MEDDLIRQRIRGMSAEAQLLWSEVMEAASTQEPPEVGSPEGEALLARIASLPGDEPKRFVAMLEMSGSSAERQGRELQEKAEMLKEVEKVFEAAYAKLRAEGKPIDPEMTVEDAYRVLGLI